MFDVYAQYLALVSFRLNVIMFCGVDLNNYRKSKLVKPDKIDKVFQEFGRNTIYRFPKL